MPPFTAADEIFMRRALALAAKGYGGTSPNPLVGAVLAQNGEIIGEGWHRRAGEPHAEINALAAARHRRQTVQEAELYVTLEPCSTFGRTPPCTEAIIQSGVRRVVIAARDPNPRHAGIALKILRRAGIEARAGLLAAEASRLNESFNHWITRREPFVTLKAAMSLDGKIATRAGESKWITGPRARAFGMRLRLGADAILAGVGTIIQDDPALTLRPARGLRVPAWKRLRRIVLDPRARIPLGARVLTDEFADLTTVVASARASSRCLRALEKKCRVLHAPLLRDGRTLDLRWLLRELGREEVTSLLIEGGGETHAGFLAQNLVHRAFFFYAPLVIGGRAAPKAVGGGDSLAVPPRLREPEWRRLGPDLLLTGLCSLE